jgi:hypothetical protein
MNKDELTKSNEKLLKTNQILSRSILQRKAHGFTNKGNRDMYTVLGYPQTIDIKEYLSRYARQDIAKRIVDAFPKACFSTPPVVQDDPDTDSMTAFEASIEDLDNKHKIFNCLYKADILASLGRFSIILIGLRDQMPLNQPTTPTPTPTELLYLSNYSEESVTIKEYDTDTTSERYSLPLIYQIQTLEGDDRTKTLLVHYSRIVHIPAEGSLTNKLLGTPRLECVYNQLINLEKVVGGAAEVFWLSARAGLQINNTGDGILDSKGIEEAIDNFQNQLSRTILTENMEVKPVIMPIANCDSQVDAILKLISAATGIPARMLTGSEEAKLAGEADQQSWLDRIKERQANYVEPTLITPFIQRLVEVGSLPEPMNKKWTVLFEDQKPSPNAKAELAIKTAQAIATYSSALGADMLITPQQFVEDILGLEFKKDDLAKMISDENMDIDESV